MNEQCFVEPLPVLCDIGAGGVDRSSKEPTSSRKLISH